jgi:hypothetical protein
MPNKSNSSFQNVLRKMRSQSDTMVLGKPWSLTTLSRTARATSCTVNGCFNGMKCAYLVYLSTTTRMQLYPSDDGRHYRNLALCRVPYSLPSVFSGTRQTSSLPSVTQKTLGKRKHSANKLFAECFIFDTPQRVSLPSVFF